MKAMVKETGEIIEVSRTENIITKRGSGASICR